MKNAKVLAAVISTLLVSQGALFAQTATKDRGNIDSVYQSNGFISVKDAYTATAETVDAKKEGIKIDKGSLPNLPITPGTVTGEGVKIDKGSFPNLPGVNPDADPNDKGKVNPGDNPPPIPPGIIPGGAIDGKKTGGKIGKGSFPNLPGVNPDANPNDKGKVNPGDNPPLIPPGIIPGGAIDGKKAGGKIGKGSLPNLPGVNPDANPNDKGKVNPGDNPPPIPPGIIPGGAIDGKKAGGKIGKGSLPNLPMPPTNIDGKKAENSACAPAPNTTEAVLEPVDQSKPANFDPETLKKIWDELHKGGVVEGKPANFDPETLKKIWDELHKGGVIKGKPGGDIDPETLKNMLDEID